MGAGFWGLTWNRGASDNLNQPLERQARQKSSETHRSNGAELAWELSFSDWEELRGGKGKPHQLSDSPL